MQCEKDPMFNGVNCTGNCYTLKGKVIDSVTNEGIANVKLELLFNNGNYTLFGGRKLLVNATTNPKGEYSIIFDGSTLKDKNGYYSISASHPSYFIDAYGDKTAAIFDLDSTNYNKPKDLSFAMFAPGTIKVHFKASKITNFLYLDFTYSYSKIGYGISLNGNRQIDTVINFKTAGGLPTYIRWSAFGNNVNVRKVDSLVVTKNGITAYNIEL